MAAKTDWDNPCEAFEKLRETYYRLIQGEQEASMQYMANGQTRTFSYSKADLPTLKAEMQSAKDACTAKLNNTLPRRRHAIQFG
jgi:hypothetical protein